MKLESSVINIIVKPVEKTSDRLNNQRGGYIQKKLPVRNTGFDEILNNYMSQPSETKDETLDEVIAKASHINPAGRVISQGKYIENSYQNIFLHKANEYSRS